MDTIAVASDIFATLVAGMHDRLIPISNALFGTFFMLTLAAILMAFVRNDVKVLTKGVITVLGAALIFTACQFALDIGKAIMELAVAAGLRAGGSGTSATTFLTQPDKIYYAGLAHAQSLYEVADQICGVMDWQCGGSGVPAFPLRALAWGIAGAFALLAVANFFAWVFFSVCLPMALVVAPFALVGITRSVGTAPLRFAAYSFAYMFALAMVAGFADLWASSVIRSVEPSFWAAFPVVVLFVGIVVMVLMARAIANTLVGAGIESAGKLADFVGDSVSSAATAYFMSRSAINHVTNSGSARNTVDRVNTIARLTPAPFSRGNTSTTYPTPANNNQQSNNMPVRRW